MGIWGSHLYSVQPERLDELIQNSLRPYGECQKQIDDAVDTICAALQETEQIPTALSVVRGGSYGRKTVLRGNSDGMIVIFVSDLEQFQDQKKSQDKILNKIWQLLKTCQLTMKLPAKMEVQRFRDGLIFQLSTKWQSITFEVLPAYNALENGGWRLGQSALCWVHPNMQGCCENEKPALSRTW